MSELSGFDLLILVLVIAVLGIWLVRFVRRALTARCGCAGEDSCNGCHRRACSGREK
jgi:hypothetical protein